MINIQEWSIKGKKTLGLIKIKLLLCENPLREWKTSYRLMKIFAKNISQKTSISKLYKWDNNFKI